MASNALWAHILRKEVPQSNSPPDALSIPPLAPLDKTGTSMRMLIHDTQANLEKFASRVDTLTTGVDAARKAVGDVHKLFESERERVLGEMADIANRCLDELKNCIGAPAQSAALESLHQSHTSAEQNVQVLHKRIDALQTLFQSQLHAIQTIQDQQNTMLVAVLPLLPLVQAVPLHVESAKASMLESITPTLSSLTQDVEAMKSSLYAHMRSLSAQVLDSHAHTNKSPRKRPRSTLDGPSDAQGNWDHPVLPVPSLPRQASTSPTKRMRFDAQNRSTPHRASNLGSSSSCTLSDVEITTNQTEILEPLSHKPKAPPTPRRPFAEINHRSSANAAVHEQPAPTGGDLVSPGAQHHPGPRALSISAPTTSPNGPTTQLSFANSIQRQNTPQAETKRGNTPRKRDRSRQCSPTLVTERPSKRMTVLPPQPAFKPQSRDEDAILALLTRGRSKDMCLSISTPLFEPRQHAVSPVPPISYERTIIKSEGTRQQPPLGFFEDPLSPLSPIPSLSPVAHTLPQREDDTILPVFHARGSRTTPKPLISMDVPQVRFDDSAFVVPTLLPETGAFSLTSPAAHHPSASPKPMSLRDRRAQMSVLQRARSSARRYIPLDSSSEDEA
ncbi:hypothetical protein BV22DRAFT_356938 [Leucogyrophana mollusca]|uniref:Uncharacterized protein n=1 Tax=Leucogyrophana mollusca TaxID=85980 RepID=A0ACB8BKJ0_9AGAM|nr:hypothetical protein BV22DRAFT_356938 [Leucogyrophana mollusca]